MRNAAFFTDKIRSGEVCLGMAIASCDPVLTEAMAQVVDSLWIDAEHAPLTLPIIQNLVMAAQTTECAALVRVAWNDPVLIKPLLDLGADGIIVPMIRTAQDARNAVAACRYPPLGVRGFAPRRASQYGHYGSTARFVQKANQDVIVLVQIEHIDAVQCVSEILQVEGLSGIVIGPNDLSFSMGLNGQTEHPRVQETIGQIIDQAQGSDKFVGLVMGGDVEAGAAWIERGVRWMVMESETSLLIRSATQLFGAMRRRCPNHPQPEKVQVP